MSVGLCQDFKADHCSAMVLQDCRVDKSDMHAFIPSKNKTPVGNAIPVFGMKRSMKISCRNLLNDMADYRPNLKK